MSAPALLTPLRRAQRVDELIIRGPLDGAAVDVLHASLLLEAVPRRERLIQCDGITGLCAAAAIRLWRLIADLEADPGYRVRLIGLPDRLAWRLRAHPLAPFVLTETELFGDPFTSGAGSER